MIFLFFYSFFFSPLSSSEGSQSCTACCPVSEDRHFVHCCLYFWSFVAEGQVLRGQKRAAGVDDQRRRRRAGGALCTPHVPEPGSLGHQRVPGFGDGGAPCCKGHLSEPVLRLLCFRVGVPRIRLGRGGTDLGVLVDV